MAVGGFRHRTRLIRVKDLIVTEVNSTLEKTAFVETLLSTSFGDKFVKDNLVIVVAS